MPSTFHRLHFTLRKIADEIEHELRQPAPSAIRLLRLRSLKIAISSRLARRMKRRSVFA